jgi:hypothetical protein
MFRNNPNFSELVLVNRRNGAFYHDNVTIERVRVLDDRRTVTFALNIDDSVVDKIFVTESNPMFVNATSAEKYLAELYLAAPLAGFVKFADGSVS